MSKRMRGRLPSWRSIEPDDATEWHSIFLRGLSLGALIGAAIAGSAIWERRRRRATRQLDATDSGPGPDSGSDAAAVP